MSNNLYPPDAPQTRRRGRRKPRPKHLPPYVPGRADAPDDGGPKPHPALSLPPAAPSFGAKKGAGNALLFHQLKAGTMPATATTTTATTTATTTDGDPT